MLQLFRSQLRWWQKPLARFRERDLPAELVVLHCQTRPDESGAWLNSRGTSSGVIDLVREAGGKFRSVRAPLPEFVQTVLTELYRLGLSRGAPDLVLWNSQSRQVRFVEVKCPHWDRPSSMQLEFHAAAKEAGCPVEIVEWEFVDEAPAA